MAQPGLRGLHESKNSCMLSSLQHCKRLTAVSTSDGDSHPHEMSNTLMPIEGCKGVYTPEQVYTSVAHAATNT